MKRILIIEDSAVIREPIKMALKLQGYETVCAGNGREGLKALVRDQPDLILLDIAMPIMNGLEFLRVISRMDLSPRPPVIMLTAAAERHHAVEAARFGATDYLLKSQFSMDQLVSLVHRRLDDGAADSNGAPVPATSVPDGDLDTRLS